MSFEGWYQMLCKEGHESSADCYDMHDHAEVCSICGEKVIWYNLVNVTNGSYDDDGNRIDGFVELEVLTKAFKETCPTCGHRKLIEAKTYKIPKNKGDLRD